MFQAFARPLLAAAALSLFAPLALADGVSVRNDGRFPARRSRATATRCSTARRTRSGASTCPSPIARCASAIARTSTSSTRSTALTCSRGSRCRSPATSTSTTVNSDTIFLVNLGDTLTMSGFGEKVGINQVLVGSGDEHPGGRERPAAAAAFALPAGGHRRRARRQGQKDQERRRGRRLRLGARRAIRDGADYRRDTARRVQSVRSDHHKIVAASLFSTQSASADLAKIRRQIRRIRLPGRSTS